MLKLNKSLKREVITEKMIFATASQETLFLVLIVFVHTKAKADQQHEQHGTDLLGKLYTGFRHRSVPVHNTAVLCYLALGFLCRAFCRRINCKLGQP